MVATGNRFSFWVRHLYLVLFLGFSWSLYSQTSFVAVSSHQEIEEGGLVTVEFVLVGDSGKNFKAPDFSPFKVYAGPSTSRSMSWVNGVSSSELKFSYILQAPSKPGNYQIGSASVEVQGKVLSTRPLSIITRPIDRRFSSKTGQEVFVKVSLSKDTVYLGEPVKLEAQLYYRKYEVEITGILNRLDYQNFVTEELIESRLGTNRQSVEGEIFIVKSLGSRLLYPTQTGLLELGELEVALDQILKSENFGFFQRNLEVNPIKVTSGPVSLFVKELPRPIPDGYIGAVGRFEGIIEISDNSLRPGQGFVIKTLLKGEGDLNTIGHPVYQLPAPFELYNSKMIFEDKHPGTDRVKVQKIFEQFCQVNQTGTWDIRPYFYYFDVDQQIYVLVEDTFTLEVKGSPLASQDSILDLEKDLAEDNKLSWALALLGLVLALLFALYFLRIWQKRTLNDFTIQAVNSNYATKDQRLKRAFELMNGPKDHDFYHEIYRLWNQFMTEELGMTVGEMSRQAFKDRLIQLGAEESNIRKLDRILEICDLSLFGGVNMASHKEGVLIDTEELISTFLALRGKT
jgi:hypothetical protein